MRDLLLLAAASFCLVGLKSLQQLNVVHDRVWWVPVVSLGLAVCETWSVVRVASSDWGLGVVLPVAGGASLGCLCAMALHRRARRG